MALILWLLVALVPCLIGMGALRILYGSQTTQEVYPEDYVLTGGMICIGLAEAAHLGAVMLGWSFSRCVNVFLAAVTAVALAAAVVVPVCKYARAGKVGAGGGVRGARKSREKNGGSVSAEAEHGACAPGAKSGRAMGEIVPWLIFAVILVGQLIYVMTGRAVYVDGDMTLETVAGFLETDAVYQVNPMTGRPYTLGIPLRLQILCLPTLYGILSRAFGLAPEVLVYGMIPGFVLLGSYLAFSTVAKSVFPKKAYQRGVFMAAVALLLGMGNYMYGMDGFGVMHAGFRGVTIRACILIPYVFGLLLRKKYKLVILCILAEACIVWTLYGMGACLLIAAVMSAVQAVMKAYAKRKGRGEGEA